MALSDLAVFSEYTYTAQTEVLKQKIDLFNAASGGALQLRSDAHQGDYSDTVFWKKVSGLVRRRNAYGTGAVAEKVLQHLVDTMVKVASGTPPVRLDPSQFKWIQRSPEEAGAVLGQQLAIDTLADMVNTALLAIVSALSNIAAVTHDGSAGTATVATFNNGQAKFGDSFQDIKLWVMHSKPLFDIYGAALTNTNGLFSFGTVNVRQDGFGRSMLVTDSPALVNLTPTPDIYHILGLVSGAAQVDTNGDFTDNVDTMNGDENIKRTYQAEWSYNVGVKGFSWDKTNGGKSPTDAALATATNWDAFATSNKDLAGVFIKVQ